MKSLTYLSILCIASISLPAQAVRPSERLLAGFLGFAGISSVTIAAAANIGKHNNEQPVKAQDGEGKQGARKLISVTHYRSGR